MMLLRCTILILAVDIVTSNTTTTYTTQESSTVSITPISISGSDNNTADPVTTYTTQASHAPTSHPHRNGTFAENSTARTTPTSAFGSDNNTADPGNTTQDSNSAQALNATSHPIRHGIFGSDDNTADLGTTFTTQASNATSHRHRNGTFVVPKLKLIDEDSGIDIDVIFGESTNETETEEEDLGSGISNAANGSRTGDSNPKTQGDHPNKIVPSSRTTAPPNHGTSSTEGIIINVILAGHGLNEPSLPPNRGRDDPGDFFGTTDAPLPKPVPKKSSVSGNLVVIIPLVCLGFVLLVLVVVLHCQNTRERRRVRQLKVLMRRDARMSGRSTDPLWRSDRSCTSRGGRSSSSRGARSSTSRGARSSSSRGGRSARSQRSQRSYELKELPHCAECYHGAALQKQQTNGYPAGKSCNVPVTRSDPNILGHRGSVKGPVEYFLDDELYKTSLAACHRKTQSEPTGLNAHRAFDAAVESPFQRVPNNSPAGSCPITPHPRYINVTEPDNHILAASLSVLDTKWTDNRLYEPPENENLSGSALPLHLQLFANMDVYQDLNSNSIQSSMGPGLDSDFGASAGLSLRIMSSDSSITGYPTTCSGNTGEALSTESSLTSTITPTPASSSTAWDGQGDTRLYHSLSGWDNQGQVPLLSSEEHWV
ncbi:uncharacterized protein [Branchiostoma lanceolatum]|uniref:uncharacterized protein n=1 Tax=Branchiostoma lanceolatum TaxID=7740 RepID=UPI0034573635